MKKLLLISLLALIALALSGCTQNMSICGDGVCSSEETDPNSNYFCTSDCKVLIDKNSEENEWGKKTYGCSVRNVDNDKKFLEEKVTLIQQSQKSQLKNYLENELTKTEYKIILNDEIIYFDINTIQNQIALDKENNYYYFENQEWKYNSTINSGQQINVYQELINYYKLTNTPNPTPFTKLDITKFNTPTKKGSNNENESCVYETPIIGGGGDFWKPWYGYTYCGDPYGGKNGMYNSCTQKLENFCDSRCPRQTLVKVVTKTPPMHTSSNCCCDEGRSCYEGLFGMNHCSDGSGLFETPCND